MVTASRNGRGLQSLETLRFLFTDGEAWTRLWMSTRLNGARLAGS